MDFPALEIVLEELEEPRAGAGASGLYSFGLEVLEKPMDDTIGVHIGRLVYNPLRAFLAHFFKPM